MPVLAGLNPFRGLSPFSDRFRDLLGAMQNELVELRSLRNRVVALEDKTIFIPDHHELVNILLYGAMLVRPNVWWYAWMEAQYEADQTKWVPMAGGRDSTVGTDQFGVPAVNGIESGNLSAQVVSGGVDMSGPDYPAGFDLLYIRGNGATETTPGTWFWPIDRAPKVTGRFQVATDGDAFFDFSLMNQHDGTCEPDAPREPLTDGQQVFATGGGSFP